MPTLTYKGMPTVGQFQKDSSVTFAVRNKDRILHHLDWLLERYHFHDAEAHTSLSLKPLDSATSPHVSNASGNDNTSGSYNTP